MAPSIDSNDPIFPGISAELSQHDPNDAEENAQSTKRTLLEKTWFRFDLDDTLHSFRKASLAASSTILLLISKECDATVESLRATYQHILSQTTSSAFTDGKSSDTYRKERFATLMATHSAPYTEKRLKELADVYKDSLEAALVIKSGAMSLLRYLKQLGKKIVIITEGPEDA